MEPVRVGTASFVSDSTEGLPRLVSLVSVMTAWFLQSEPTWRHCFVPCREITLFLPMVSKSPSEKPFLVLFHFKTVEASFEPILSAHCRLRASYERSIPVVLL